MFKERNSAFQNLMENLFDYVEAALSMHVLSRSNIQSKTLTASSKYNIVTGESQYL
jgi:hypothetical protein